MRFLLASVLGQYPETARAGVGGYVTHFSISKTASKILEGGETLKRPEIFLTFVITAAATGRVDGARRRRVQCFLTVEGEMSREFGRRQEFFNLSGSEGPTLKCVPLNI